MANRTDPLANSVSGTDPQNLLEYITRQRVYDSRYWKEDCFGLSVEDVLEKSCGGGGGGIRYVGGYPTPFLALTLKLLQLHPEPELVAEAFVRQRQFKYARALGCLYLRLTGRPVDIYEALEPLYGDYRKLRFYEQTADVRKNEWTLVPVDAFVHRLLTEPRAVGIALPRLPPRRTLVDAGYLPDGPRPTPLEDKLKRFGGGGDNNNNNNDGGGGDGDGNNNRSAAVGPLLALLEHKASVEKSPFAVEALERRRRRRKAGGFVGVGGKGEDDGDGELLLRDEKNKEEDEDGDAAAGTSRRPKKKRRETKPDREEVEDDDRDGDDGNRRGVEDESAGKEPPTKEEERKQEKKKKNKKKDKKRNYENLFKKGGNGTTTSAAAGEQPTDEPQQQQQQQSDEYWNEERAKLGLKPLR